MQSFYSLPLQHVIVTEGIPSPFLVIHDQAHLSREDRFILEKHSQDIFKMLLRYIFELDMASDITEQQKKKAELLLSEYLETRELLAQE